MEDRFRKLLQATCAALVSVLVVPSFAEDLIIEEITVTATKQEASLQDVPVALAVMTGDKINEQGAFSLEDIVQFIPNVDITETSGSEKMFIRGIGTYGNSGFEQSVGTFVDGVYRGRGQASRAALLDLERVEVLKGPQNTLFGKNTVSGALNITSASPTDEFEASISGTFEPEFDGWGTMLVLSGPLSETFRARLALRVDETDGYMNNLTTGKDERQEEEFAGRLTLDWDASDYLNLLFKWETGDQDTTGRQNKVAIVTPTSDFIYRAFGNPNFVASDNYDKYQDGSLPGRPPQYDDSQWDLFSLTATADIGDFTLKSITGYIDAEVENALDLDFAPIDLIGQQRRERHEQFTQEFILFSPKDRAVEFLVGLFYQDEKLRRAGDLEVYLTGIAPLFATHPLRPFIQAGFGDITLDRNYDQDTESFSAFTQATWHATDSLRVQLGLRYAEDKKTLDKLAVGAAYDATGYTAFADLSPSLPHTAFYDQFLRFFKEHRFDGNGFETCNTTIVPVLSQTCTIAPGFDNVRKEDHVTGDIIVQYDLTDSAMIYGKWGTGYKAGGFDEANLVGNPATQEFEDEQVSGFEVGAKFDLWAGRARLNVAAFHNEFEDLQVSVFDGAAGFAVSNAGEATSKGIEMDGQIQASERLSIAFALSLLDSEYDAFPGAACHAGATAAWSGPPPCVADLSGEPTQFAPNFSGHLAANYRASVGSNLDMEFGADVMFKDSYLVTGDNDPVLEQDGFAKVNARIALLSSDDRWSLAVLGKNLTDKTVVNAPDDIPLGNVGFAGSYFYFMDPPRSYELQFVYRL
ncbi:MAG: TonB-dependent receptor [Gammaproteobacteria bacterium]|nr:TonB-dependent receptor [Gammaproteobacteria bacterium]MYK83234.1 TonB-dependent receptor [Gammaproteobacteria bacterium]